MTTALRSVLRFGLTAAAITAFLSVGIAAPASRGSFSVVGG